MNKARVEFYQGRNLLLKQRWRWRLVAANNEIVAASSEGFVSYQGAIDNLKLATNMLRSDLPIVVTAK